MIITFYRWQTLITIWFNRSRGACCSALFPLNMWMGRILLYSTTLVSRKRTISLRIRCWYYIMKYEKIEIFLTEKNPQLSVLQTCPRRRRSTLLACPRDTRLARRRVYRHRAKRYEPTLRRCRPVVDKDSIPFYFQVFSPPPPTNIIRSRYCGKSHYESREYTLHDPLRSVKNGTNATRGQIYEYKFIYIRLI